jgi:hypothetical protein
MYKGARAWTDAGFVSATEEFVGMVTWYSTKLPADECDVGLPLFARISGKKWKPRSYYYTSQHAILNKQASSRIYHTSTSSTSPFSF